MDEGIIIMTNPSSGLFFQGQLRFQGENFRLGSEPDRVANHNYDRAPKPSIFQRAWEHVTPKNVVKVGTGLALAAGYVALWLFAPPVALAVSLVMINTVAAAVTTQTLMAIFGNDPAPAQNQAPTINLYFSSRPAT